LQSEPTLALGACSVAELIGLVTDQVHKEFHTDSYNYVFLWTIAHCGRMVLLGQGGAMLQWPAQERRRSERVNCGASAALFTRSGSIGSVELCNLSAGGALVESAGEARRGHLVHLVLRFEGIVEPIGISALIHEVRKKRDHLARLALTFPTMSADLEDYIQDAVLASLIKNQVSIKSGYKAPLPRS